VDKSGFISVEANAYLNSVISRVSNMSVDTESSLGDDLKKPLEKTKLAVLPQEVQTGKCPWMSS